MNHGVIVGKGAIDWFSDFDTALDYAKREHEATGLSARIIDNEWNTVSLLKED